MILVYWILSLGATVIFVIWTFLICFAVLLQAFTFKNRRLEDPLIYAWSWLGLKLFRISVVIDGKENIPQKSCLYLFNHASLLDILVLYYAVPQGRFGSKAELFNIPIFGAAIKAAGTLKISRDSRTETIQVYREARARVDKGEQFFLSPEGGRNFEEKLLPFKSGPFIFALETGMDLAPVVIHGACHVLQKKDWIPATRQLTYAVKVTFLPVYSVAGKTVDDRKEIIPKIRAQMLKFLPESAPESVKVVSNISK